jgi:hypothetical protein
MSMDFDPEGRQWTPLYEDNNTCIEWGNNVMRGRERANHIDIQDDSEALWARSHSEWAHPSSLFGHCQSTRRCVHQLHSTSTVCSMHVWHPSTKMGIERDVGTHKGNRISVQQIESCRTDCARRVIRRLPASQASQFFKFVDTNLMSSTNNLWMMKSSPVRFMKIVFSLFTEGSPFASFHVQIHVCHLRLDYELLVLSRRSPSLVGTHMFPELYRTTILGVEHVRLHPQSYHQRETPFTVLCLSRKFPFHVEQ